MEIYQKRVDFISTMKDSLTQQDAEMNDVPYFNLQFLIERFLKLDPADLVKNKELKDQEKKAEKKDDSSGTNTDNLDLGI